MKKDDEAMTKYTIKLDSEKNPRDLLKRGLLEIVRQERQKAVIETLMKAVQEILKVKNEFPHGETNYLVVLNRCVKRLEAMKRKVNP